MDAASYYVLGIGAAGDSRALHMENARKPKSPRDLGNELIAYARVRAQDPGFNPDRDPVGYLLGRA